MASVLRGLRWAVDRMLSVGYGVVYDFIFERFPAYQRLRRELLGVVQAGVPAGTSPSQVRILDIGCGPGNFSLMLAEAGFNVVGVDTYDPLVALAQEKRRAQRMPNAVFTRGNVVADNPFAGHDFDQVINVHFLYAHADPRGVLGAAQRALRPGGQAVFVNLTRRVPVWATFSELRTRAGLATAVRGLLWVLPNAIFETIRRPAGPHYWNEEQFATHLREAGFEVLELRRTFFDDVSILARVRKPAVTPDGRSARG